MYKRSSDPRFVLLRSVADTQRGLFTAAQAEQAGFSYRAMSAAVDRGRWIEVAPFVYRALPAAPMPALATLHAATLSAHALAARRSALALVDLAPFPPVPQLVVVRTRRNLDRPNVHSTRSLPDTDCTVIDGIPSTTIVRATIDACDHLPRTLATRVITKGIVKRRYRPDELYERAEALRNPRRPGAYQVLRIMAGLNPSIADARNEWETLIDEAAKRFGLPAPIFNLKVDLPTGARFLDAGWPAVTRAIEYDGYWEHLVSVERFDDDRSRQTQLQDAGWIIDHCTNRMLRKDAAAVFAGLCRAYGRPVPVGP
jgi:hypothetical protein